MLAAPTPVPAGDPPYIATFTNWFGVFAGSRHPKQAEEFVTFLASPRGQRLRMRTVGDIPISSDLAQKFNWAGTGEVAGRTEGMQVVRLAGPSVFIPDLAINIHRVKLGAAIHIIRYGYDDDRDEVPVLPYMRLDVRLPRPYSRATTFSPAGIVETDLTFSPDALAMHRLELRDVPLYCVVHLQG